MADSEEVSDQESILSDEDNHKVSAVAGAEGGGEGVDHVMVS